MLTLRTTERGSARVTRAAVCDKPMAAPGLISYRYRGAFGWIMIGAVDTADALREARRSVSSGAATPDRMQVWNGSQYVPVDA